MPNRLPFKHVRSNLLFFLLFICFIYQLEVYGMVRLGVDHLFSPTYQSLLQGRNVGLITNHTGINSEGKSTIEICKQNAPYYGYSLSALFAPEHGLRGSVHAGKSVEHEQDKDGLPVYSLHGTQRRPTPEMLQNISLLIYDIQDLGSRTYTYITTLFYVMEEAAKAHIPVIVLDRPNPLGGLLIDGPMLEEKWRSFIGYINVPYCHGLTIGELALFFNNEYKIGCELTVIPMTGWKRHMTFDDTGLMWVPTSPNIPEASTAFYYPTTGFLGELAFVNMGVGYTLPFRVIGAPWINAEQFAEQLNAQNCPGVFFSPFHYRPFFGRFAGQDCHGILISIRNPQIFLPVTTQFILLGVLKNLYPCEFQKIIKSSFEHQQMFNKATGTAEVFKILTEEKYVIWKLRSLHQKEKNLYLEKRKAYLLPQYL